MKTIEKSPDRLLVRHTPWLLGGVMWLMGLAALFGAAAAAREGEGAAEIAVMALLGLLISAAAWWFAPKVELAFDRRAGRLRFTEARILDRRHRDFPLEPELRVAVEADHSDGARLTRLVLRANGAAVPLERGYGSADRRAVEAEINGWLDGDPGDAPPRGRGEKDRPSAVRRR